MEESKTKKNFSNKIGIVYDMMMGLLAVVGSIGLSALYGTLDNLTIDRPSWLLYIFHSWLVIGWVAVIVLILWYVVSGIRDIFTVVTVDKNKYKEEGISPIRLSMITWLSVIVASVLVLSLYLKLDKIAIDTPVWLINVAYSVVVIGTITVIILFILLCYPSDEKNENKRNIHGKPKEQEI